MKAFIAIYIIKLTFASFEYTNSNPQSLFPFNRAAEEINLPGSLNNPANLPFLNKNWLNSSIAMPFSLDGLLASEISMGFSKNFFAIGIKWNMFGIDEYRENKLDLKIGIKFFKMISLGAGLQYYNLSIATKKLKENNNIFDSNLSITFLPWKQFGLSFLYENIFSNWIEQNKNILYPGWSAGVLLRPTKGLQITWNINRTNLAYINSISLSANIFKFLLLNVGYAVETSEVSVAISVILKKFSINYGFKFHEYLGVTNSIGITISTNSLFLPTIAKRYDKEKNISSKKRINIQTATLDELLTIPGLKPMFAERIIKYKKTIGPITFDALIQIGLTLKEAKELTQYVYGITSKDKFYKIKKSKYKKRKFKNFKRRTKIKRKELFNELVQAGIDISTAYKISEYYLKNSRKNFNHKIISMKNLSKKEIKIVKKICKKYY